MKAHNRTDRPEHRLDTPYHFKPFSYKTHLKSPVKAIIHEKIRPFPPEILFPLHRDVETIQQYHTTT